MFDREAIKQDFGRAASGYDAFAQLQHDVRRRCIDLAKNYWRDGATILDAGCGTAALSLEAPQWSVISADLAFGMCQSALQKSASIVNAEAKALPFADQIFDGIFSSLMLQWVNDPAVALRELYRVALPGYSILSTFTANTLHELKAAFAAVDGASHVSDFLTAEQWKDHARAAGFEIISAEETLMMEHVTDAATLMRSLKAIGATHKKMDRRRGLMTPKHLTALEKSYAELAQKEGLPVSWKLLYLVLRKA